MKKFLCLFILLLIPSQVLANKKIEVKLDKCVDGDTSWFIYKEKSQKFRFLAIDTPESTNKIEEYGKEASLYTCNKLKKAKKIEIQFDENSEKKDKYNRYLVWIFIDNNLLQEDLVENGYAEVKYLYGNYEYTNILKYKEKIAMKNKIGIHKNKPDYNYLYVIVGIITLLLLLLNKKFRRKFLKKLIKKIYR